MLSRGFLLVATVGACALVATAVLGQDGTPPAPDAPPLRRGDSVTLDLGSGGTGRITLPGGDAVIPGDGALLRTLTELDREGEARTKVLLEDGSFDLEGRGGGPRIQVLGLDVLPGVGSATVTIDKGQARISHSEGGPVVIRLGSTPDAPSIVLHAGGAVDLQRTGANLTISNVTQGEGRVLLSEAQGWSSLGPGATLEATKGAAAPTVTNGEVVGGAKPPEIPSTTPATGSEEVSAKLGRAGRAVLLVSDGSSAKAEAGASVVGRWTGGPNDRRATLATTGGTVRATLRSSRTSAETPGHRITATDAAGITMTVNGAGERIEVDANGAPASITTTLPHAGPRIRIEVGAGDAIQYAGGDPAKGIRYQIPTSNGGAVTFTVGSKQLKAAPGTEVIFRPDGKVEVIWPEGPEELFRFAFGPETLVPAVTVPYTGLPDLLPPPPVSPSNP